MHTMHTSSPADAAASSPTAAVDAAAEAFKTWSTTPFPERAACLLKFAEEVEKKADELAKAQTMEQGKPLANSMGEVRNLIASCKRYAETVSRL